MPLLKISAVVTAYNHEKYIAQCLDGILAQKGNFSLEVILGDDCSQDNTRQIMQQYAEKYPNVFILVPPMPNLGVPKNIERCLDECTGDYFAFCEGDDYWTDVYKIQKQLEFLENHPDYSLCFNAIMLYFENDDRYAPHPEQLSFHNEAVTTEDLIDTNYIGNFSCCMYRASIVKKIPKAIYDIYTADWMFNMACGRFGKIGFIRDWMSVYRIHAKGAWSSKSHRDQCRALCNAIDSYNKFFAYEYNEQFSKLKAKVTRQYGDVNAIQVDNRKENLIRSSLPKSNQQMTFFKKCGNLVLRSIRNPRAAYKKLRTSIINIE